MTTRLTSRLARRLAAPALVVAAAAFAACSDIGTDPTAPVSIAFSTATLPWPSILLRDTLRDSTGAAVKLTAVVFNANGDTIPDFPVEFLVTNDTARVVVTDDGYLVSTDTTAVRNVSIQARAGRLVPPPVALVILPAAPDTIVGADTVPDTLAFTVASDTATSRSELRARVASGETGVSSFLVQWSIVERPVSVDTAWLVASQATTDQRSRRVDTTDASGIAGRFVRAVISSQATTGVDTMLVQARILVRGLPTDSVLFPIVVLVNR